MIAHIKKILRTKAWKNTVVVLFFGIYLIIGLCIFDDYGISFDEECSRRGGIFNYNYVLKRDEPSQLLNYSDKYYGPAFDMLLILIEDKLPSHSTRTLYLIRHLVTFLLFYTSVFFFYLLGKNRFSDWKAGLLGSAFLVLSPRIFAHSFYNPKDLPFLAVCIISMYTLVKYLEKMTWLRAALHAIACGILIDIRIMGMLVPCLTYLFVAAETLPKLFWKCLDKFPGAGECYSPPGRGRGGYYPFISILIYTLLLAAVTILFFPVLWEDPLHHFVQAFSHMKQYPWPGEVLYFGRYIKATALPWHYIPVWIGITSPILYLVTFGIGLVVAAVSILRKNIPPLVGNPGELRNSSPTPLLLEREGGSFSPSLCKRGGRGVSSKRASLTSSRLNSPGLPLAGGVRGGGIDLLCIFWFFLPVLVVIWLKSVLYDGWRHLFFVYPALLLFSVNGIISVFAFVKRRFSGKLYTVITTGLCALMLLSLVPALFFMHRYHPYQNVYFNRLAGKDMLSIKQNFELEYWGLSFRQAFEYILQHDHRKQIPVFSGGWEINAHILPDKDKKRLIFVDFLEKAEYFVSNYRYHPEEYPYEHEFFSITIDGAQIMVVYKHPFSEGVK